MWFASKEDRAEPHTLGVSSQTADVGIRKLSKERMLLLSRVNDHREACAQRALLGTASRCGNRDRSSCTTGSCSRHSLGVHPLPWEPRLQQVQGWFSVFIGDPRWYWVQKKISLLKVLCYFGEKGITPTVMPLLSLANYKLPCTTISKSYRQLLCAFTESKESPEGSV